MTFDPNTWRLALAGTLALLTISIVRDLWVYRGRMPETPAGYASFSLVRYGVVMLLAFALDSLR